MGASGERVSTLKPNDALFEEKAALSSERPWRQVQAAEAKPLAAYDLVSAHIQQAEILCIGTEILMGQILNRNAQFLARALADLGINHYHQSVVGDNPKRARRVLEQALDRSDLVIITGGLGPTTDDISMALVAETLNLELLEDEQVWQQIQFFFARKNRACPPSNRKQALFPAGAWIWDNPHGTACGAFCKIQREGQQRYIALLPGPPAENQPMFQHYLAPFLAGSRKQGFLSAHLHFVGIGESQLASDLGEAFFDQDDPSVALYCSTAEVEMRLTTCYELVPGAESRSKRKILEIIQKLQKRYPEQLYEIGQRRLAACVADLLRQSKKHLALAESCTGGLLASTLVDLEGASDYFLGSLVAYQNAIKHECLGVSLTTLEKEGAVSAACALEMAQASQKKFQADLALSVTGYAGREQPKQQNSASQSDDGLVFIGLATSEEAFVQSFHLSGGRQQVRRAAVTHALNMLRIFLLKEAQQLGLCEKSNQKPQENSYA